MPLILSSQPVFAETTETLNESKRLPLLNAKRHKFKQLFNTLVYGRILGAGGQNTASEFERASFHYKLMKNESAKERIRLAAGPIFAAKGFETATVREICAAADVNVASINYHFGDKKGLYIQTLFLARELREQQVPLPVWTNGESADEKLRSFIELLLQRIVAMRTEPWEVRLLLREVMAPTDAAPPLIENYFRPFLDQLMSIVDSVVGHRLPDHQRHQIGFSIIGQCLHYRVSGEMISLMITEDEYENHFDVHNLAEHIWRFSLGGLHGIRDSINHNQRSFPDPLTR